VLAILTIALSVAAVLILPARAQQPAGSAALTLEQLEALALENNPTLRQADAEVRAAEGRRRQAGLLPNPRVGYTGEEIRGGAQRGGLHGFFVEQEIVLGGKLRLGQRVFEQEARMASTEAEEQKLRVLNAVRLGYVQVLAAQETVSKVRELLRLTQESADTAARLRNVGQADETEVLQAEM
jgi:cobalt-zinc-cadmium efflux system outer membrane protein